MTHPMDLLKIAVVTWLAVFAFNRLLKSAGLASLAATQAAQAS